MIKTVVLPIIAAPLLASVVAWGVEAVLLHKGNVSLVYMATVLFVAAKTNTRTALACAGVSFLALNLFFTEPRMTLIMNHREDIYTAVFFLITAIVTGQLTARLKEQLSALKERDRVIQTQVAFAEKLVSATEYKEVSQALNVAVRQVLQIEVIQIRLQDGKWLLENREPLAKRYPDLHRMLGGRDQSLRSKATVNCENWLLKRLPGVNDELCLIAVNMAGNRWLPERVETVLDILLRLVELGIARIRLADALQSERLEKEKELLRSALLSSVSHDLRTPLASLVGSSSSLLELKDSLSESQKAELIEAIQQEARRLDSYTQNLLDMTRLGRGDLKLERDWVAIEDIISSVVKRAKKQLPQAKLKVKVPSELPILHVHAALIGQAIFNLVDNAAKFSPPGKTILISAVSSQDSVEVIVTDSGPGIPQDQRERIFDMFHVLGHGDRDSAGTGLGLTICRGMVGAHGGRVFVTTPEDGKGTAMHIVLPLPVDAPPEDKL